jgi:hypothetical protein
MLRRGLHARGSGGSRSGDRGNQSGGGWCQARFARRGRRPFIQSLFRATYSANAPGAFSALSRHPRHQQRPCTHERMHCNEPTPLSIASRHSPLPLGEGASHSEAGEGSPPQREVSRQGTPCRYQRVKHLSLFSDWPLVTGHCSFFSSLVTNHLSLAISPSELYPPHRVIFSERPLVIDPRLEMLSPAGASLRMKNDRFLRSPDTEPFTSSKACVHSTLCR